VALARPPPIVGGRVESPGREHKGRSPHLERTMRKRMSILESATLLFVAVLFLAFFLVQACGCGTLTLRYNSSGKETAKD